MTSFEEWFNQDTERLAKKLNRPEEKIKEKWTDTLSSQIDKFINGQTARTMFKNDKGEFFSVGDEIIVIGGATVYKISKLDIQYVHLLYPPSYANDFKASLKTLNGMTKVIP